MIYKWTLTEILALDNLKTRIAHLENSYRMRTRVRHTKNNLLLKYIWLLAVYKYLKKFQ